MKISEVGPRSSTHEHIFYSVLHPVPFLLIRRQQQTSPCIDVHLTVFYFSLWMDSCYL